ncbi:MAG: hypothetical protein N4A49_01910 [Marinifilaceae bacterium]|jgi:hypothetical protein|nr:hypothetical protein [Marinifilaceae bacterium]
MKIDFNHFYIPDEIIIKTYKKAGITVKRALVVESISSCSCCEPKKYVDWVVVNPYTQQEIKMSDHFQSLFLEIKSNIILDKLNKTQIVSSFKYK